MLKSKIKAINNLTVTLDQFKKHAGGITFSDRDAELTRMLNNAVTWVSDVSNFPACADLTVSLTQDRPVSQLDLLYGNVDTITSVKNFITGDDVTYTTSADKSRIYLDYEAAVTVEYTCTKEDNATLQMAVLNYALILFTGDTDPNSLARIKKDLRIIQNDIY